MKLKISLTKIRSGSTYTGDLLTAASNSVYFFEPFTEDRQNYFTPWEEILVNQTRDKIEGMLFCNNVIFFQLSILR